MISFSPTEEQTLMRDAARELATTVLAPRAREHEASRGLGEATRAAAIELGLGAMLVPESAGGAGLGLGSAVLVEEELGAGDAAAAFALPGPGAFHLALAELGDAAQLERGLAPFVGDAAARRVGGVAFSESAPSRGRAGFTTSATRVDGGYELVGEKAFVSNAGEAAAYVVFAQVDESKGWDGIGAFLVDGRAPGLSSPRRHDTLGLDAARFGTLALDRVRVAEADRLLGGGDFTLATLSFLAKHGLIVAARALGLSRTAWATTRDYAEIRRAFGKPIGHFQAVAFTLVDRLADVEAARGLVTRAAWAWDAGRPRAEAISLSAQAIATTLEAAMRTGDDAVQLHGGAGFIRDLVVEKLMRDAKQLALSALTAEQCDQIVAAIELGAPLDPALVLPTPETQSIFT